MYSKDSLKLQFGCFWDAYRHLKAQFTGWKLSHPSWAGVVDAFNNPPATVESLQARIAELEAQIAAQDIEAAIAANGGMTPELFQAIADGKFGKSAAIACNAGWKFAGAVLEHTLSQPVQPPTRARKLAAVA